MAQQRYAVSGQAWFGSTKKDNNITNVNIIETPERLTNSSSMFLFQWKRLGIWMQHYHPGKSPAEVIEALSDKQKNSLVDFVYPWNGLDKTTDDYATIGGKLQSLSKGNAYVSPEDVEGYGDLKFPDPDPQALKDLVATVSSGTDTAAVASVAATDNGADTSQRDGMVSSTEKPVASIDDASVNGKPGNETSDSNAPHSEDPDDEGPSKERLLEEIAGLEEELQNEKERTQQLDADLAAALSDLAAAHSDFAAARSDLAAAEKAANKAAALHSQTIKHKDDTIVSLREDVDVLRKEQSNAQKALDSKNGRIKQLDSDLAAAKTAANNAAALHSEAIKDKDDNTARLLKEIDGLRKGQSDAQAAADAKDQTVKDIESALQKTKSELANKTAQGGKDGTNQQPLSVPYEVAEKNATIRDLRRKLEQAEKGEKAAEEELAKLIGSSSNLESEAQSNATAESAEKDKQLKKLQDQFKSESKALAQAKRENTAASARIRHLESQVNPNARETKKHRDSMAAFEDSEDDNGLSGPNTKDGNTMTYLEDSEDNIDSPASEKNRTLLPIRSTTGSSSSVKPKGKRSNFKPIATPAPAASTSRSRKTLPSTSIDSLISFDDFKTTSKPTTPASIPESISRRPTLPTHKFGSKSKVSPPAPGPALPSASLAGRFTRIGHLSKKQYNGKKMDSKGKKVEDSESEDSEDEEENEY